MSDKLIVVCGMSRGGSNLLWNFIQSHPNVCSSMEETYPLLWANRSRFHSWFVRISIIASASHLTRESLLGKFGWIIEAFEEAKRNNITCGSNKYKYPRVIYTSKEIEDAALCIKSTDSDILLNALFRKIYPSVHYVYVVRHPYAIANGWIRRGKGVFRAALFYRFYLGYINRQLRIQPENVTVVGLNQLVKHPFAASSELNRRCHLNPSDLENIRLKSKKVMSSEGSHSVISGAENEKYWYSSESIRTALNSDIDEVQKKKLNKRQIWLFNLICPSADLKFDQLTQEFANECAQ